MKRLTWLGLIVVAMMAHIGCSTYTNVTYSKAERKTYNPAFFMDREGDLYPPGEVYVDRQGVLGPGIRKRSAHLKGYYRRQAEAQSADWAALVRATGITPTTDFDRDWTAIQAHLRARAIALFQHGPDEDVLLVVHGFNNDFEDADEWIDVLDRDIRERRPRTRVVRMYWDGLARDVPIGIWAKAQFNGPPVGHGLRRILNQLDPGTRLRILTHSSGAFVVTNALGDGSASFGGFEDKHWRPEVAQRAGAAQGDYTIPSQLTDLRVAMLVPAQPANAFDRFVRRTTQGTELHGAIPRRLVLGTSRTDEATSKLRTRCGWFGATCMATEPEQACDAIRRALSLPDRSPSVAIIDFPAPINQRYHPHGVVSYMQDMAEWNELMRQLFGPEPAGTMEAQVVAGAATACV
ncbi:hypothetical protein BEN78_09705 [Xanthomonas citri pv. mangiferaeindicae]|nr:hypothetical protein BEN78_09705 [Xanthomonas citri pv. mangiferaeindicae]